MPEADSVYVGDSSGLIALHRTHYPQSSFPSLWARLTDLIHSGRFIIPEEVFRELDVSDDELITWLKLNPTVVRAFDEHQESHLKQVLSKFPELSQPTKLSSTNADPFVVALALAEKHNLFGRSVYVVCHERKDYGKGKKSNIPIACDHFSIPVITMLKLVQLEGWTF